MRRRTLLITKVTVIVLIFTIIAANFFPLHEKVYHNAENVPPLTSEPFVRTLGHLLGPQFMDGNKITAYQNGIEIFPAMLESIRSAQKTITFEAYIYWSDDVGQKFIDALAERARNGVKVHLLIDWMGSRQLEREYAEKLKEAGVEFEYFRPLSFVNLPRMNNRTHRRILVVDGKIGFTGGVGICNEWDGDADSPELWRDTQYKIEGPAVSALQSAFMDSWLKIRPEVHHDERYFPELKPVGKSKAQVFKSSPEEGGENVRLMYQIAIASARTSIKVASAYFLPDKPAARELIEARKRGVEVEIIIPGPYGDAPMVKHASRDDWGELLKAGIKIYEYQPARYHRKSMIVDGYFVSVGSTNFDNRSFRLNDEENLNVLDSEFAHSELVQFEQDKSKSTLVKLEDWEKRPLMMRVKEKLSSMFEEQL